MASEDPSCLREYRPSDLAAIKRLIHSTIDACYRQTLDASLPSKQFYDSLGYSTVEEASRPVANGQSLRFYRMRKPLDQGVEKGQRYYAAGG